MELRSVDPRSLKSDPDNPRKIAADEMSDRSLTASIQAVGILQPPIVRQRGDDLIIKAGARRVRAAINLDLQEILVLVLEQDDGRDGLRSLVENVVRAPMSTVDLWRAVEALTSDNWTPEAIADALAVPVRQIKKLKLLAHIHPAILAQIGAGDMPKEDYLRTVAAATSEEQASVWKKLKPKKGQTASWWEIARALDKRRLYARAAKFGADEEQAFGIVWEDDLFSQGDEDSRYTTQADAFFAAQQAWLEAHLPKNGVMLALDDYGSPKFPPKAERIWGKAKKGDMIGQCVNPRDGSIVEVAFRQPTPDPKKKGPAADSDNDDRAPPAKMRPEITQKGNAIIGDLRSDSLTKALRENDIDDVALMGLLILGYNASNISIRTGDYSSSTRAKLLASVAAGGHLTMDLGVLRRAAREMLASFLSLRPGMNDSGVAAKLIGDAINADQHLPNMATEEFLSCLSKPAIEKAAASRGVVPRPRGKDTRAALIEAVGSGRFVHPAALFAQSKEEIAAARERALHHWRVDADEMEREEAGETVSENDGADDDDAEDKEFRDDDDGESDGLDNEADERNKADGNAHLDDDLDASFDRGDPRGLDHAADAEGAHA